MQENPRSIQDLEAPQRLRHQRYEWIAERIGWGVMGLTVLAALAGALGQGPLSSTTETSASGKLSAEFDRVHRAHAPACLRIRLERDPSDRQVELAISRSFEDATVSEEIVPQPAAVRDGDGELIYTFELSGDEAEQLIEYRYEYDEFGRFDHAIRLLSGDQTLRFRQIILP